MYSLLFRNRVAAIGFVLLTVAGAASMVGTEENAGLLEKTTEEIKAQQAEFAAEMGAMNAPKAVQTIPGPPATAPARTTRTVHAKRDANGDIVFTDDEALIDDAAGFDPSPMTPLEESPIASSEEVVIILNNGQSEQQQ